MAKSNIKAVPKAKGFNASKAAGEAVQRAILPTCSLIDIGENLATCHFIGWTVQRCINGLIDDLTPIIDELKQISAAAKIRIPAEYLRELTTVLSDIRGAAMDMNQEFDGGMHRQTVSGVLGAGIASLSERARVALDQIGYSLGMDRVDAISSYVPDRDQLEAA